MQQLLLLVQRKLMMHAVALMLLLLLLSLFASRSGRCPARHYMQQLLPLVQSKAWPFTGIISHRMPLQQGVEAYKMFAEVTRVYKYDRDVCVVMYVSIEQWVI
jgi:hypothetical protein